MLDPYKTCMLALTLVQGVDTFGKCLELQTPLVRYGYQVIPHKKANQKLLLIMGRNEFPGWVFSEGQYYTQHRYRKALRLGSKQEDLSLSEEALDTDTEQTEESNTAPPYDGSWIKSVGRGEAVHGQRWRIRRDIGKSAKTLSSAGIM